MEINPEDLKKTSIILAVTDIIAIKDLQHEEIQLKGYQRFGFRFFPEFSKFIKNYRIHFYHFNEEAMENFILRDKVYQRIARSVGDLRESEKILIVIDKENYDRSINLTGEKFEAAFLGCVPENDKPLILDMSRKRKEIEVEQLAYFWPDGVDKQGGFLKDFTSMELRWSISDN